jgi:hypothetical protein
MHNEKRPGVGGAGPMKDITKNSYPSRNAIAAHTQAEAQFVIEHVVTIDGANAEPWPPVEGLWALVRRLPDGRTLWRQLRLE